MTIYELFNTEDVIFALYCLGLFVSVDKRNGAVFWRPSLADNTGIQSFNYDQRKKVT